MSNLPPARNDHYLTDDGRRSARMLRQREYRLTNAIITVSVAINLAACVAFAAYVLWLAYGTLALRVMYN